MSADILKLFEGLTSRQIQELQAQITATLWQLRERIIEQYPPAVDQVGTTPAPARRTPSRDESEDHDDTAKDSKQDPAT